MIGVRNQKRIVKTPAKVVKDIQSIRKGAFPGNSPGQHEYGALPHKGIPLSHLRFAGNWTLSEWSAAAATHSVLQLHFHARRVYLVMGRTEGGGPSAGALPVRILLDGHPIPNSLAGSDVKNAKVMVGFNRLYRLVNLPEAQAHMLTVEVPRGVSVYDFTFG